VASVALGTNLNPVDPSVIHIRTKSERTHPRLCVLERMKELHDVCHEMGLHIATIHLDVMMARLWNGGWVRVAVRSWVEGIRGVGLLLVHHGVAMNVTGVECLHGSLSNCVHRGIRDLNLITSEGEIGTCGGGGRRRGEYPRGGGGAEL